MKRKPGRPKTSDRKPRNVQISDEHYMRLCEIGGGRAANGIAKLVKEEIRRRIIAGMYN